MRLDNKHLLSWLLHRKLKLSLKSKGLTEIDFEVLLMIKLISDRVGRVCYIKDLKLMLPGMSWNVYTNVYSLSALNMISFVRSKRKWAGKARMELTLTPEGNELIELLRMKSESELACIKHQLDNERSLVNAPIKRKKAKAA